MPSRNETLPITIAPKPEPPTTSWWMDHPEDRQAWSKKAAAESQRMNGSKEAHRLTPRILES